MAYYDLTTSYTQNPFVMQTPYYYNTYALQTPSFNTSLFGGYQSMLSVFPKTPIMSVFDYSTFGYTPTTESCYLGQGNANPPYNVYPYVINTIPQIYSFPTYLPQYNFGSLTGTFNSSQDFYSNAFANFGNITLKNSNYPRFNTNFNMNWTNFTMPQFQSTPYNGKNPTINRALELAVAELGTSENHGSNDSAGIRKYKNGARNNLPWCASFVSWLYGAGQGSLNNKTFGYSMQSQTIRRRATKAGFYASKNSGYRPKVGDLMILKYTDNSGHIGIVTKVNADGSFETIEGNQSNKVKRVHRTMNTAKLDGFVRMDDWLKAA